MSSSESAADPVSGMQPTSIHETEAFADICDHDVHHQPLEPLQRKEFDLQCAVCGSFVARSSDLRFVRARCAENKTWMQLLRVVVDEEFPNRISIHPHWEPRLIGWTQILKLEVTKEKKILCKICDNDWGVRVRIQDKVFFLLKIVTLKVVVDGEAKQFEHWKEVRYFMRRLSDTQLMTFGRNANDDDHPLPSSGTEILSTKA